MEGRERDDRGQAGSRMRGMVERKHGGTMTTVEVTGTGPVAQQITG